MILAGDIGGTNTRLALFDPKSFVPIKNSITKYPSGQHKSLEAIIEIYLSTVPAKLGIKKPKLKHGGFGVAGPVRDGKAKTTNLPWMLDSKKLSKLLGLKATALVNDLYATAAGIEVLPKKSFTTLRKGTRLKSGGNRAVVAPGTGLGHASLVFNVKDGSHIISPSEAGHSDFAPVSAMEFRLLEYIAARDDVGHGFYKRCCYENVLSGPGLRNIYNFLVEKELMDANATVGAAELKDQTGLISQAALAGTCPTCVKAMDMLVSIFGRQAGNFCLDVLALDGVYLGGGIPPRILAALQKPMFLEGFNRKGSQAWVADVPVHVITDDLCALYGAANCARRV